jgi:protein SCO1/2
MRPYDPQRLALAGILCLLLSVWWPARVAAEPQAHSHSHPDSSELPPGEFTKASLYQLESTWITATGQRLHLGDLRGKVRVLVMHYASCEYACPILISVMQNIEKALAPEVLDKVGFVTVTFDPERDTPAVLKAYSDKMHLDPQRWTLLHGQPDDVLELAVLLGVKYKKDLQGGFAHSNLITVLNKEGESVYRHTGLYHPLADTLAVIAKVAEE